MASLPIFTVIWHRGATVLSVDVPGSAGLAMYVSVLPPWVWLLLPSVTPGSRSELVELVALSLCSSASPLQVPATALLFSFRLLGLQAARPARSGSALLSSRGGAVGTGVADSARWLLLDLEARALLCTMTEENWLLCTMTEGAGPL